MIEEVKRQNRSIETAYLLKKKQVRQMNWSSYEAADVFHFHHKYWNESVASYVAKERYQIRLYGIEGTEKLLNNPPSNIIGWITDYPQRVREA